MNRRSFIKIAGAAALFGSVSKPGAEAIAGPANKIDRKALVDRHKIVIAKPDPLTPLSVGNGEFAFTADITGLQTFPDFHSGGIQIHTMAQWGWHTTPDSHNYKLSDTFNPYDSHGRQVPYPSGDENGGGFGDGSPAASWLNANPHKYDLGRVSLTLPMIDNRAAAIEDLSSIDQQLDLWTGLLSSQFVIAGQPVSVETVAHPALDILAVRLTSPLVENGQIGISFSFSYAPPDWLNPSDWNSPTQHTTELTSADGISYFDRQFDKTTRYNAIAAISSKSTMVQMGPHEFTWNAQGQSVLTAVFQFAAGKVETSEDALPSFEDVKRVSAQHWHSFWTNGGVIDLSASSDSRWKELERRIVLSQYQTAINSSGSFPPQETGLVQNSWYGKFHHEMHWWHAAHFPLWNRPELLMRSLSYYKSVLPVARETASRIGCAGARWPKMVGPEGRESPNRINPFLTWQQPHPVHFAELVYQARPTKETLELYKDIVLESAEFMASFPWWNEARSCFEIGPPSVAPYENNFPYRRTSKNPTFDLAHWAWALGVAQQWRVRLGMARNAKWDKVRENLAPLTVKDGIYRETEEFDTGFSGHPTMLGALGVVPKTDLVDLPTMQKTLDFVLTSWSRGDTWGWDYPMMAMTAARLGRPDQAIEALFIDTQKNVYLANGHNYQQGILPLYLPGNGGLLFVTGMMAAGWKGAPPGNAPGFPSEADGWNVRWEGLLPAL